MISIIRENLEEISRLCRRRGVQSLYVVGSAAREDFDLEASDIDFLVEFAPRAEGKLADRYFLLRDELERLLGRKVELVQLECVENPVVRATMEHARAPVYVAA